MSIEIKSEPLKDVSNDLRNGNIKPSVYGNKLCGRIDECDSDLQSFVSEPMRRDRLNKDVQKLLNRDTGMDDRPPLFGVPVGIKDIIHTENLDTRAGTALPPELFAGPEASCVTRLRDAGAVVLGKTVTTEFAGAGPGLTRNPHDLEHTPGGSSSGSAAAVAAGLCPLSLGTQTGGSVIRPAAFCGIVGMKPSFERIPRDGVIERSESADHVGMFTQDVAGMEIAAAVLCNDWSTEVPEQELLPAIGIPKGQYLDKATNEAKDAFESQLEALESAGCTIKRVSVPTFEEFDSLDYRHNQLTDAELAFVHEPWYDDYKKFYRTKMAERIEKGRKINTGQLAKSRRSQIKLREELETLLDENDLDVWAAPAAPGPAPKTIQEIGNPVMNRPWTHSGLPVVTVPAGSAENGLPLGIQLIAPFMADEQLLQWAKGLTSLL